MRAIRKKPVHAVPVERHNEPVIILVTVCAHQRKPLFAKPDVATLIVADWQEAHGWNVGRYVLLPDHIHFFCSPANFPSPPLHRWVRYWKTIVARRWPRREEHPLWQLDFWDTQVRHHTHYSERWEYVRGNPVRAGLAIKPEQWPFQGELHELRW